MPKTPKDPGRPVDAALRDAFAAVEAQPVPPDLSRRLDQISAPSRRPDGRS